MHDGDGVCEPFEKTSSVLDCGPYTPDGFVDLWAAKAYASHQDVKSCPASLVTGEPVVKVSEGTAGPVQESWGSRCSKNVLRQTQHLQSSSGSVHWDTSTQGVTGTPGHFSQPSLGRLSAPELQCTEGCFIRAGSSSPEHAVATQRFPPSHKLNTHL